MVNTEDDPHDTIRPRCENNGADLKKIKFIEGVGHLKANGQEDVGGFNVRHVDALRTMIDEIGDVSLVVLDPITGLLGGRTDDYKNTQIREALEPLKKLAEEKGFCLILITHLKKASLPCQGAGVVERILGSVGYVNLARQVWVFRKDPNDKGTVIMAHAKGNVIKNPKGLSYRLEDEMFVEVLDAEIEQSANDWERERFKSRRSGPPPEKLADRISETWSRFEGKNQRSGEKGWF